MYGSYYRCDSVVVVFAVCSSVAVVFAMCNSVAIIFAAVARPLMKKIDR